jgi:DMSO/TMAO reductase YedYZ molybdopterin-dependent catalytic subunit
VHGISRRGFLSASALAAGATALPESLWAAEVRRPARPIIYTGTGPGRGNPPPHSLKGDDLVKARLTPETWGLDIVADGGCTVEKPGKVIDFPALLALGKTRGVKFFKAMQCRGGCEPQSHGIWEGVPLRDVLRLAGRVSNVMRVYFNGFHNNDPKQLFQSSASFTEVAENRPGELPVMVAYRHNGGPISLLRGGPVRLIVPWAYGFKNIKWLQRIRLTNDHKAIDTYGGEPDAYQKTQVPSIMDGPASFKAGTATSYGGRAVVGLPGLKRVEYWLRPGDGKLAADDPAWQKAAWLPGVIDPPPDDWKAHLPAGISPADVWGFDPRTGRPRDWPLRYTVATWTVTLRIVERGEYELRVRTVDQNDFAQPEPRPQLNTGRNAIPVKLIKVT